MKRYLFLLLITIGGFAAHSAPTAYFSYTVFNVPGKGPYVETYLTIIGNTVSFPKNTSGSYQGTVTISMNAVKGDKSLDQRKYNLLSQPTADSLTPPNFTDIQRFFLENGEYTFNITVSDAAAGDQTFSTAEKIVVNVPEDKPSFSSIEFVENYSKSSTPSILTKSGLDLVPYNSDFFPENMGSVIYYAELYNAAKVIPEGDKFLIEAYIRDFERKRKFTQFGRFTKETPQEANVVFSEIDLKELGSGNFELVIEMRDKENKLICSTSKFFQRRNRNVQLSLSSIETVEIENTFVSKISGKDTLMEYMRCVRPISEKSEITHAENILKTGDIEMMKKFVFTFWQKRNNVDPEGEWLRYFEQVKAVNRSFGNQIEKGYLTDRGRVYLQYGTPDNRNIYVHESSSYPYEIWQYNKLRKQSNRKFVFYDPELLNNYKLLHSDALGEPYEPRWQIRLRSRDHVNPNIDKESAPGIYGNNPDDNFRNPK